MAFLNIAKLGLTPSVWPGDTEMRTINFAVGVVCRAQGDRWESGCEPAWVDAVAFHDGE